MKHADRRKRYSGSFTLPYGVTVPGALRLRKSRTSLRVRLTEKLPPYPHAATVTGLTDDFVKVTCLDCLIGWSTGGWKHEGEVVHVYHHSDIFPHYIAIGDRHLDPAVPSIEEVHFRIDDAESLFYDFGAFGHVFDATTVIDDVLVASKVPVKPQTGDHPMVAYFTGKLEVVSVDTAIGQLSVTYKPSWTMGGPKGVYIKGGMTVALRPLQAITFKDCIERLFVVQRFMSLLAGRTQGVSNVQLWVGAPISADNILDLKFSYPIRAKRRRGKRSWDAPHPGDLPLDAVRRTEEFERVLRNWVEREEGWRPARARYADCIAKGNRYDANRLIAAANMFDILPEHAVPPSGQVEPALLKAKEDARAIFRALAESPDRNSVLDAIGRVGKPSLPKKVAHRTSLVEAHLGMTLPDLQLVARTAVRYRNYFVHGSSDGLNVSTLEPLLSFLTDALEFIFAASDLIEAGWDAKAWSKDHYGSGHSFTRFRSEYKTALRELRTALET